MKLLRYHSWNRLFEESWLFSSHTAKFYLNVRNKFALMRKYKVLIMMNCTTKKTGKFDLTVNIKRLLRRMS